jgi:hypothetical protein
MPATTDNLLVAIEELVRVLNGPAGGIARLERALGNLEQTVQRHAEALGEPDGLVGQIDRPRVPSPGLDRHTEHLREELAHFLEDIRKLRRRARSEGQTPPLSADPENLAGALPVAPEAGALSNQGVLVQRARQLARALERYENEEADLLLDTVNMDIGAPD